MRSEDKWAVVWTTWFTVFAVAETIAIMTEEPEAPLSHQLRRVLGVRQQSVHRRLGQVAFATGVSWLGWHLWREVAP